tara:strand:- start:216 stop:452 length:237 start_codon:yes stop_codon:yes gene_type:complete
MNNANNNTMKFTKTYDVEQAGNFYISGNYEIYRERTYKNNGTDKCDGDWIVQNNGQIEDSFKTLKEAKNYCIIISNLF